MNFLRRYITIETQAGLILTLATFLAIVAKNSFMTSSYDSFLSYNILSLLSATSHFSMLDVINDGLMSIFFFIVSLELKRELYAGHLSNMKNRLLPALAAFGGMLVPAVIYLIINTPFPEFYLGATIPVATDIAFAVSLFQIFASKTPYSLKISLLSLAIFDDLGSILLIAILYSQKLNVGFLLLSLVPLFLLVFGQRNKIYSLKYYSFLGLCLWLFFTPSGLHPTLSGVITAFCIPIDADKNVCPLHRFEEKLHYWVSFFILPLFAFANGGIVLEGFSHNVILHPVTIGCSLGLAIGKPLGVIISSYIGIKIGICALPPNVRWSEYIGMALLTGVGFTMSLFLGILAFPGSALLQTCVRFGVLFGTCLSSSFGILLFQILRMLRSKELEPAT
jgi:NhaA family Na+:H+ antiporter